MFKEHAALLLTGERAICHVGHETYPKGHVLRPAVVPSARLLFLRSGKLAYHYAQASSTYHTGQMWLVPELTRRHWRVVVGPAELMWVEFVSLVPIRHDNGGQVATADRLDDMMFDRIVACWEQAGASSRMELAGLFDAMLLRFALRVNDAEQAHRQPVHSAVVKVLGYLAAHSTDAGKACDLSQKAGLSPNHFRKVFKETTGMSPTQYVQMMRLRRAKYLLVTTTMTVQEVAYAVGYKDAQQFSRQYRRCWNMSPKQDRMSAP